VVALELVAESCVNKFLGVMGPSNPQIGRKENPKSMRAIYGQNEIKNAVHGSESSSAATRELSFFFDSKFGLRCPACFNNCSCLLIKPHIVTEGYVGQVIDRVLSSQFQISAMEMFWLDRPSAEEFLEIYKTVLPEYNSIVDEFTNGSCIALEVRGNNVVQALRELCGHFDPEMARSRG
jgi:nucleoside-diphosphate kinase